LGNGKVLPRPPLQSSRPFPCGRDVANRRHECSLSLSSTGVQYRGIADRQGSLPRWLPATRGFPPPPGRPRQRRQTRIARQRGRPRARTWCGYPPEPARCPPRPLPPCSSCRGRRNGSRTAPPPPSGPSERPGPRPTRSRRRETPPWLGGGACAPPSPPPAPADERPLPPPLAPPNEG